LRRAFVDTSAWLGYINARDDRHEDVKHAMHDFAGRLVTSNFVFDELITLCKARLGQAAAVKTGKALRSLDWVSIVRIEPADESAAWDLFVARGDQPYSFTDCTSFVLMRRLGLAEAIALDDDFRREGFVVAPG
jgi:predicted nucleic acid-binding protein